MNRRSRGCAWRITLILIGTALWVRALQASALTDADIAQWCADAEGASHCAKLIERAQLERHPGLASRHDGSLDIVLSNGKTVHLSTSQKSDPGPRDYSVWDVLDEPPYVVVWTQEDEGSHFLLINRETGWRYDMPGEPILSPDKLHIANADFCARGCANELALWAVLPGELRKSSTYSPAPHWTDAGVQWISPGVLRVDTETDTQLSTGYLKRSKSSFELKLDDKAWKSVDR